MYVYTCMCIHVCACTHVYACGACVHVSESISDDFNLLCVLHLSYSNRFSDVCIVGGSMNPYRNGSVARVKLKTNTHVKIPQSAQLGVSIKKVTRVA